MDETIDGGVDDFGVFSYNIFRLLVVRTCFGVKAPLVENGARLAGTVLPGDWSFLVGLQNRVD